MFKKLLLAAVAVATMGTSIAAEAQPRDRYDRIERRHDRIERRQDRREFRHDRRQFRQNHRGRYFWHGRYYNNRYRHNGAWMYR